MRASTFRLTGLCALTLSTLTLAGCPSAPSVDDSLTNLTQITQTSLTTLSETESTDNGDGDPGDGDPGDGDPGDGDPGDGDGDPGDGDGDPGDGDGDPGDGDGDPANCSDSDSGNAPWEPELEVDDPETDDPLPNNGPNFVPLDDIPQVSSCDVFMQDCPMGEKCVPYASMGGNWDANKCVPVMGNQMAGQACVYGGIVEATDDCDETTACWDVMDVNGQSIGVCTPFCEGTPQAPICPPGTSCLQGNDGSIAFCVDACNPLTQECEDGEACYWTGDGFNCTFTTQDIPVGQPCGFINDCAEGLMCVSAEALPNCNGAACCAEFCDLDCGGNVCSAQGTTCQAFFEMGMAPIGNGDVGVCLAP